MTIGELIQTLGQYPSDMMVVVRGYETGFDDPSPYVVRLIRDYNWVPVPDEPGGGHKSTWYYGRHTERPIAEDGAPTTKAICL